MHKTAAPREHFPGHSAQRRSRLGWRFVLLVLAAAVILSAVVRAVFLDVYFIPSGSMEPLLNTGDRVLVSRTDYRFGPIERGDVVVFDGRGSFAPLHSGTSALVEGVRTAGEWLGLVGSDTVYVKRVIGIPGDHVSCCAADGRLTLNGQPVAEGYIYPGDAPSEQKFDVVVPEDRLWLLGDHRAVSADSRSLLGAPGGGLVPEDKVIGRVLARLWPPDRTGAIPRIGLQP